MSQKTGATTALEGSLPVKGTAAADLRRQLQEARLEDARWRDGRVASLVYFANEEILNVAKEAYNAYFSENGLGLRAFHSLARFESEVVAMLGHLLNAPQAAGNMTSGGTESNLLAVKTARDRARVERPGLAGMNIVMPVTAHASFDKAAHYFGLKAVRTPVGPDYRADLKALKAAISPNTIMIVGSAPSYVHGVIDPILAMGAISAEHGLSFHVDACMGGMLLPFLEKLNYPLSVFDFRAAGVTSMSADIHKYGFAAKGASVILYRDGQHYQYQPFTSDGWPSGTYSTPTLLGTRPGGAIAAAWAVLRYLGQDGYMALAEQIMQVTRRLIAGINTIPELVVWGEPEMSLFGYGSRTLDIFAVADGLEALGWYVNRQSEPPGIHLTVTPVHEPIIEIYLSDVAAVVDQVVRGQLQSEDKSVRYA